MAQALCGSLKKSSPMKRPVTNSKVQQTIHGSKDFSMRNPTVRLYLLDS
jgi:hypothetical protein